MKEVKKILLVEEQVAAAVAVEQAPVVVAVGLVPVALVGDLSVNCVSMLCSSLDA